MSTDTATAVSAAWCEVLGVPQAADDQNFFDLGGDSLMAIMFMERIESGLNIEFPMETLFADGGYGAVLAECIARQPGIPG
ncbi:acyl carrier protein [Streptomyces gelaticus]